MFSIYALDSFSKSLYNIICYFQLWRAEILKHLLAKRIWSFNNFKIQASAKTDVCSHVALSSPCGFSDIKKILKIFPKTSNLPIVSLLQQTFFSPHDVPNLSLRFKIFVEASSASSAISRQCGEHWKQGGNCLQNSNIFPLMRLSLRIKKSAGHSQLVSHRFLHCILLSEPSNKGERALNLSLLAFFISVNKPQ